MWVPVDRLSVDEVHLASPPENLMPDSLAEILESPEHTRLATDLGNTEGVGSAANSTGCVAVRPSARPILCT